MWTLFVSVMVLVIIGAVASLLLQNVVVVDPAGTERKVVTEPSGGLKVLGPGNHYLLPIWRVFGEPVSINREPVDVKENAVKSTSGAVLFVDFRYDIVAGRPFDEDNGMLVHPWDRSKSVKIDDPHTVRDDMIISAVTKIDYSQRQEIVAQRVDAVVEKVCAWYSDEELMLTGEEGPIVPPVSLIMLDKDKHDWIRKAGDPETKDLLFVREESNKNIPPIRRVTSAAELYQSLSSLIELLVNYELRFLGINIVSFRITNLIYKDPKVQKALEMKTRLRHARAAKGTDTNLSDAEVLAASEEGQLGQAVLGRGIAEAGREFGRNIGKGQNGGTS